MKVLIVEDEKIINDYITEVVKSQNIEVISVYDVKSAMDRIEEGEVKILITDLMMEPIDGFKLLEYLQEKELRIPIIVISALNDEENLLKAYQLGCIDYLTKPINKEILISKVNSYKQFIYGITRGIKFDDDMLVMSIDGYEITFTKTEYELVKLLQTNATRVFTKEMLLEKIWLNNLAMSEKIVDVNIFNIRKKLGKYSYLIKNKRMVGYYFED